MKALWGADFSVESELPSRGEIHAMEMADADGGTQKEEEKKVEEGKTVQDRGGKKDHDDDDDATDHNGDDKNDNSNNYYAAGVSIDTEGKRLGKTDAEGSGGESGARKEKNAEEDNNRSGMEEVRRKLGGEPKAALDAIVVDNETEEWKGEDKDPGENEEEDEEDRHLDSNEESKKPLLGSRW